MTEPVSAIDDEPHWSSAPANPMLDPSFRRRVNMFLKSAIDRLVGALLAVIVLPVVLVLAAVLAARLRAWPFFGHRRVGRHGQVMVFPKLRTLRPDTHPYALKEGGTVIPADRFCAFLRRRHFDELPQVLLVPLGKLSLVGPRPKMPERWEPTDPGYRTARQLVPQGCTGLWQIGRHAHQMVHHRPAYDFCYLQYGSIRMDLWIMWRTVLLFITGATVRLNDVPRWVIGRGWVSEQHIRAVGGARFLVPRTAIGSKGATR